MTHGRTRRVRRWKANQTGPNTIVQLSFERILDIAVSAIISGVTAALVTSALKGVNLK